MRGSQVARRRAVSQSTASTDCFKVRIESEAAAGNVLVPLARLLLSMARREATARPAAPTARGGRGA